MHQVGKTRDSSIRCSPLVPLIREDPYTELGESVCFSLFCISPYLSSRVSYDFATLITLVPFPCTSCHWKEKSASGDPPVLIEAFLFQRIFMVLTPNLHFYWLTLTVVSLNKAQDASVALIVAAVWTGLIHLALGILGTFVLKRFPTSFSVGFFLGVLVVLANQNIILYAAFHKYQQGSIAANQVFASLGFVLFAVLTFMSLLLVQFKNDVIIAPMDGSVGEDSSPA